MSKKQIGIKRTDLKGFSLNQRKKLALKEMAKRKFFHPGSNSIKFWAKSVLNFTLRL